MTTYNLNPEHIEDVAERIAKCAMMLESLIKPADLSDEEIATALALTDAVKMPEFGIKAFNTLRANRQLSIVVESYPPKARELIEAFAVGAVLSHEQKIRAARRPSDPAESSINRNIDKLQRALDQRSEVTHVELAQADDEAEKRRQEIQAMPIPEGSNPFLAKQWAWLQRQRQQNSQQPTK